MNFFTFLIFFLGFFSSAFSQKLVFCYWRSFQNANPSLCTHVIYAFASINANGGLGNTNEIKDFIHYRDEFPKVKLLFSIAASGAESPFKNVAESEEIRKVFAENVLEIIEENNLDGVDIDWEYPDNQQDNFALMLQELYELLHPRGFLVTLAAGADINKALIRYNFERIDKYVDYINLMTYHYHGRWENRTGVGAPLYSSTATIYTVHRTVQFWKSKINETEKFLLGLPLYGPQWTLVDPNNVTTGATAIPSTTYLRYFEICQNILKGWTRYWDDVQKAPIAYGDGMWTGYEDSQSIQEKIDYLNENELGGAMIWEMSMDDADNLCGEGNYPLMTLVKNAMMGEEPFDTTTILATTSTDSETTSTIFPTQDVTTSTTSSNSPKKIIQNLWIILFASFSPFFKLNYFLL